AEKDISKAKQAISDEFQREMQLGMIKDIQVEKEKAIVAIVGEKMKKTAGIAGRFFQSLGKNGINVYAIAQGSSELNISAVISSADLNKALNTIHDVFFLSRVKTAHLFLIGPGLIGSTVLELLKNQQELLASQYNLEITLNGIINTSKALLSGEGIDPGAWKDIFNMRGISFKLEDFVQKMKAMNLPNSIVLDCTSSEEVVRFYPEFLSHHIAVVTPNKKANSSEFAFYQHLQELSREKNVPFLYETNVGAGLPIIQTIRDLIMSGDKIFRIEGILSGTMNFIFSRFMETDLPFSAVVQEALEKGFTEPHPEDDLNGMDVGRKILILAREAGYPLEMSQVEIQSLIPEGADGHLPLEEFFTRLNAVDEQMNSLRENARKKGMVLRYTA
ncbi:MAG: bifunctional aspartate kinase/homoserine dehydrogenase I, partial [Methanobacteriota archaeon]